VAAEPKTLEPKTLQDAILYFADADNCLGYIVAHRWPDGVTCPTCGRADVSWLPKQRKWQCKSGHARRQFSVQQGTIFADSRLGLEMWFPAVWLVANAMRGVSSYQLARSLGVTQKTAWFMLYRIREAIKKGSVETIGSIRPGDNPSAPI